VPKHFSRVGVIQIPNFVLGVSGAPHVATTGEIGTISIVETTFNSAKETLQFTIDVAEPESSSSAAATTATKATNSSNNNANNNDNAKRQLPPMSTNVPHFAQQLVDIALPHIDNDAARAAARAAALKQFENELYLFKNAAYAAGNRLFAANVNVCNKKKKKKKKMKNEKS
jgi:alanyl-tRNA synthetase